MESLSQSLPLCAPVCKGVVVRGVAGMGGECVRDVGVHGANSLQVPGRYERAC